MEDAPEIQDEIEVGRDRDANISYAPDDSHMLGNGSAAGKGLGFDTTLINDADDVANISEIPRDDDGGLTDVSGIDSTNMSGFGEDGFGFGNVSEIPTDQSMRSEDGPANGEAAENENGKQADQAARGPTPFGDVTLETSCR